MGHHATLEGHGHQHDHAHGHDDIVYPAAIPFVVVHLICFAAIWTGISTTAVIIGITLYFVRMWAITAGFHRYFSHRSYKTSRAFQFFLGFLGQTCAQRGVLWWSSLHRHHHQFSDTEHDVHSPVHNSLLFSHMGWIFSPSKATADYGRVPDLTRYPELVWLDKHPYLPAVLLGAAVFFLAGWPGLIVGFFWSTVLVYHGSFSINSFAHTTGKKRYLTGDESRNNFLLALITLGEGWHNNHHAYQSSTRQGFRWWEIDVSYYVLWMMSKVGLVWELRAPPPEIVRGEQRLGRKVIERVAQDLATSFPIERIAQSAREAWSKKWDHKPTLEELRARAEGARVQVEAFLQEFSIPELPTVEELRVRALEMYHDSPSLDEIAERAREILVGAVSSQMLGMPGTNPA